MKPDATLAERVDHLLETAITMTASSSALVTLHKLLVDEQDRLRQPMRVAIVGIIKAGKSTFLNALLGEAVVPIGDIETTFNVNVLRYDEKRTLTVHFKDGRLPEARPFSDLAALTARKADAQDYLLSIRYLEATFPNDILRAMRVIDTPGLESTHVDDSRNTRDFLQLHGKDLDVVTQAESSKADAVLFLFSQSIAQSGATAIEAFQGPLMGNTTPINSMGVLTKVDYYWPEMSDPLAEGHKIATILQREYPQIRRLLYSIEPVCGLLALGAQTLTVEHYETLIALSAFPATVIERRLEDLEEFSSRSFADLPVAPDRRKAVVDLLGQYGVWRAYQHLHSGITTVDDLREALLQDSGLPHITRLIRTHFGERALLIKLRTTLARIDQTVFRLSRQVHGIDLTTLKAATTPIQLLAAQNQEYREFELLRLFYEGRIHLNESETRQLLTITGEYGKAYWQRLDLPGEDAIPTIERLERARSRTSQAIAYWRQRTLDPGLDANMSKAVEVMARAYERIDYRLFEAINLLNG